MSVAQTPLVTRVNELHLRPSPEKHSTSLKLQAPGLKLKIRCQHCICMHDYMRAPDAQAVIEGVTGAARQRIQDGA